MSEKLTLTVDGNEAVTSVAYRLNEVIAIYPITPSSPMGEVADAWSAERRPNLWGDVPDVVEMQSEGGAAGAVHGALQAGALATTFTASQGLLLMIPNLYKIAGELTAFCVHVASRTLATHALSIFGDHSDVMACRQTGMALLCSGSVQEAHDLACIAHAATLASRVPVLHFFDGFRTSHEIARIAALGDDDLRAMIDVERIAEHRRRALTPDHPVVRGTAQNPDAFFQAREAINPFYLATPAIFEQTMERFARRTGRSYRLFDYAGHPQAESVIVVMGSAGETAEETVAWLRANRPGTDYERTGVLKVRLYRPFSAEHLLAALPATVRALAVLDRTKEPGALGEPLYQDVVTALGEAAADDRLPFARMPRVIGGRYGLSSKEMTPAMVLAVFDELLGARPKRHFTVGITDDVTNLSLAVDESFDIESDETYRAVFYGLGADGTVGANKNSLKILGDEADTARAADLSVAAREAESLSAVMALDAGVAAPQHVQGYFVYDSKKSGAVTVSHLRFGSRPIRAPYLIRRAHFVACHSFPLLDRYDVLEHAADGATVLLNTPHRPDAVWDALPREVQESMLAKRVKLYVVDAYMVARAAGLGGRINTVMQTCFFALTGLLPRALAVRRIKETVEDTYGKLGPEMVRRNIAAIEQALSHLHQVVLPQAVTSERWRPPVVPPNAPDFVRGVTALLMAGKGDRLPVSAFPVDGTWPVGTSRWEKRNVAQEIPAWDPAVCIQCNLCVLMCPHAAIRAKVVEPATLEAAPQAFLATAARAPELAGLRYVLQVAPEDCTGCVLCVEVCPARDKTQPRHKAIDMVAQAPILARERTNYEFFRDLPEPDPDRFRRLDARTSQLLEPLFEASGACAGCGETPYLKLLTQLFGDRALIANATGCSSIYSGNLPTTPYSANRDGRGPAWSNSLFEDNAEFGLGFRLAVDAHTRQAKALLEALGPRLGDATLGRLLAATADDLAECRDTIALLRERLATIDTPEARRLELVADYLLPKSVWLVGGDGWAYDIGYGGLDHVLASGRNVNVLVLDTEVYSNTGGQQSKATPLGAAAKFASAGKATAKKDLGMEAMSYTNVYVARVAMGARPSQTVQAFLEAEAYDGPSLILAYSPCIAHGYDLRLGAEQSKLAVACGTWPLYRFDPRRIHEGKPPLALDSPPPTATVREYMRGEARFRMVEKIDPQRFRRLQAEAQHVAARRYGIYQQLAGLTVADGNGTPKE